MSDIVEGFKAASDLIGTLRDPEVQAQIDKFIELGKSAMRVGGIVAVNALAEKFFGKGDKAKEAVEEVKDAVEDEEQATPQTSMDLAKDDAKADALMLNEDTDEITGEDPSKEEDNGKA
jgi:hypothetical protein